ncbi:LysR substrate-binding domain-containing protein [Thalassotalea ponticola]|uniref:LysR substrate-binding domain-containing protein n=1 Tax=Thalassotalea ponticola TaxID=1523392 RepID=UPI0025B2E9AA|nr:LysR substrate-binding domain-containing protein [Thalassotalea ponticola]MDN3651754.1 LysR substrate-binding domain-containing protein [Thalassotalea ponticola]
MNNHLPNLKHLQYLVALYKHQHFHHAADACFVSQSTLSSAIIKLEQLLDCSLIERQHKHFVFTPHGKVLVRMAEQILYQADQLVDFASAQGNIDAGRIYIGSIPTVAPFLLTDVVDVVKQRYPKLELYITEAPTAELLAQLRSGDIDVAVLATPVDLHGRDDLKMTELGNDPFYIAGDKKLVEQVINESSYQHLPAQSIFLLSDQHCLTEHAMSACKLIDKSKLHPFSATSLATLLQMTIHHSGITFLPEMAVKKGIANLPKLCVLPLPEQPLRTITMLERVDSQRSASFALLANVIKRLFEKN